MSTAIAARLHAVASDRPQGQPLSVVPILGPSHDQPAYKLLCQETLADILVTEVSQAGSVPELRVQNKLQVPMFLMDGQELIGAKQNRILNTDVLVPANATITIPVSCVEQGRWHSVSANFSSGKSASHRIRSAKLARVHQALKTRRRHDANQAAVWEEVEGTLAASATNSPTSALNDAYARRESELNQFRSSLKLPPQAVGLAVFQSGRFQGLDLFDRHSTLEYFWTSLLDSYALDLLAEPLSPAQVPVSPEAQAVRQVLDQAAQGHWDCFESPGSGADWRWDDTRYAASSLVWEDAVVLHLQVFPKAMNAASDEVAAFRPRVRRRYGPRGA